MNLPEFMYVEFAGNTLWQWTSVLLTTAVTLIGLRLVRTLVTSRVHAFASRTNTELDDLVADLLRKTKLWFLLVVALFIGSHTLAMPDRGIELRRSILVIAFLIQVAVWANTIIVFWFSRHMQSKLEEDAGAATSIGVLRFVSSLIVWSVVILMALDNLGIDVTALVAGLGVGGIAVALAAQTILGDLFASLSIVLDKPFVIGDFIIVGDFMGSVEYIGLKTTRVRSLGGEQLIFSNSDLLQSRIRNYKRMQQRRVVFSFGVVYQTPADQLARIPEMVREIIGSCENAKIDRVHFKAYGDFSLNFEVVYYVSSADFAVYMDCQQAINLALYTRFEKEGIEFAYPTSTVYLAKENNQTAAVSKS